MASAVFLLCFVFFFNDTATTEIYTLSLHDALPISPVPVAGGRPPRRRSGGAPLDRSEEHTSELQSPYVISYAVFCLKKKTTHKRPRSIHGTSGHTSRVPSELHT